MLFLLLAVPVAIIDRSITREEIFREPREFLQATHKFCRERYNSDFGYILPARIAWLVLCKLAYLFTCEFCASFWISLLVVWQVADYSMEYHDWRGTALAVFVVMGVANVYMGLFNFLMVTLEHQRNTVAREKATAEKDRP